MMSSAVTSRASAKAILTHPETFLNAFELSFPTRRPWRVALYHVERIDQAAQSHAGRGGIKNAAWRFYFSNRHLCSGPHRFVIDINSDTVAVPEGWNIPAGREVEDYRFTPHNTIDVSLDEVEHGRLIRGLLREAWKRCFKAASDSGLGELWQHYNEFCQVPSLGAADRFLFCRKIGFEGVALRNHRWVVQLRVSTVTVDGRSIADHLRVGQAKVLAKYIKLKRRNRKTRANEPTDVAVLYMPGLDGGGITAQRLELENPDELVRFADLAPEEQRRLLGQAVACKQFNKPPCHLPPDELRLILDPQITQEDHRETILDPLERYEFAEQARRVIETADVFGVEVGVTTSPIDAADFPRGLVAPPAVRVRGRRGEDVIPVPDDVDVNTLRHRGRERVNALRRHGLLQHRGINPLLACPKSRFSAARAKKLKRDLNAILDEQNLPFRFQRYELYDDAAGILAHVQNDGYDCTLVVLPEGRLAPRSQESVHEQLKQRLPVPSQCIQYDNTYWDRSRQWNQSPESLPRRVKQNYINCIWGLAVKNHFIPFVPAERFHYNVHIGIDVGGRDNNRAVLCVGYGYDDPRGRLVFLAEEIPVTGAKAEPIPVDALQRGVIHALDKLAQRLLQVDRPFDMNRTLFLRDGSLLGSKEHDWNERDAFEPILDYASKNRWLGDAPLWSVVEISKTAEGWRSMTHEGEVGNPVVGSWIAPFDDPNAILLSTTGAPYLTQGTASPLLIHIGDIVGRAEQDQVLRDIVWEADMCFTKPDMGMRLPWVVYVANQGALQLARHYEISGVPV